MGKENLILTYWRCEDCLEAFTLEKGVVPDECSCGGKPEVMGDVVTKHTVETVHKAPCDDRCTNAQGPVCDCKCNCANHGTRRLVKVRLVDGKYKVEHFSEKNLQVAKEFRELLEACKQAFFKKYGFTVETQKFIQDRKKWWEIKTFRLQFVKAKGLRVHKKRMEKLHQFLLSLMDSSKQTEELVSSMET